MNNSIDVIKQLCDKNNIAISKLEAELNFSNGSLIKTQNLSAERVHEVAKFFDVPMEYILTGDHKYLIKNDEMIKSMERIKVLEELNVKKTELIRLNEQIIACKKRIKELEQEYSRLKDAKD